MLRGGCPYTSGAPTTTKRWRTSQFARPSHPNEDSKGNDYRRLKTVPTEEVRGPNIVPCKCRLALW